MKSDISAAPTLHCSCGAITDVSTIGFWGNECPSCSRDKSLEVLILRAELARKATKACMVKITPARRREIARKAAEARWRKGKGDCQ